MFQDILGSDQSLFMNEDALDYSFVPKLIPYRETQQKSIAHYIKPLFQNRTGRNIIVHGKPGVGKTVAVKHLFREIDDESDEVIPIYINCWKKNTTFKILVEICNEIGYKFTQNKNTEELFEVVKNVLNKKAVVFAFDEIDKIEDFDFLYMLLEEIYKKSIILITNYHTFLQGLDERVKSRLVADVLEFKPYNLEETIGVLKKRVEYAFVSGVFEEGVIDLIAKKTFELNDMRTGLHMLREAGLSAEDKSSKKISLEDANAAIDKLDGYSINSKDDLQDEAQDILELIKANSGKKMGDLFNIYQEKGGSSVYRTFVRKVKKLSDGKFVNLIKKEGGAEGNITIVEATGVKKLNEF
jgi:archaeal cell division control protein 6